MTEFKMNMTIEQELKWDLEFDTVFHLRKTINEAQVQAYDEVERILGKYISEVYEGRLWIAISNITKAQFGFNESNRTVVYKDGVDEIVTIHPPVIEKKTNEYSTKYIVTIKVENHCGY